MTLPQPVYPTHCSHGVRYNVGPRDNRQCDGCDLETAERSVKYYEKYLDRAKEKLIRVIELQSANKRPVGGDDEN